MNIVQFIEKEFPKSLVLENISEKYIKEAGLCYDNAKADAVFAYTCIKKYLKSEGKILEVGGGLHFLSSYLNFLGHNIIAIEPGGFDEHVDIMREKILKKINKKFKIKNNYLEEFCDNNKDTSFNFIYSIDVLEHTKNIKIHLEKCLSLLANKNSILYIRCPNYLFPFENHFYKFFIPFAPKFTFEKLYKKKLIKSLGEAKYYNTLNYLNFNCTYWKIKNYFFPIKFHNPLKDIFERIDTDIAIKKIIFSNKIIKIIYKILNLLSIKGLLIKIFPISFNPYLIMELNNKENKK